MPDEWYNTYSKTRTFTVNYRQNVLYKFNLLFCLSILSLILYCVLFIRALKSILDFGFGSVIFKAKYVLISKHKKTLLNDPGYDI